MKKKSSSWTFKKLKDGSVVVNVPTNRTVKQRIYEAALLSKSITLQDLLYQKGGVKTNSFKHLVVAAFIYESVCKSIEACKE